ncbi:hypothetical protein JKA74_07175 [Marivirga sp. S37H4]|uniref:Uncharacterized protein n=1 Tax=Marivirga aurantiaca TaxID=2802615 RepID=A0A934WX95_9BACT|nr:hypothetical protein [Marivirga aurantiaca]MBK6264813.1 hypothetical protein [Marivirga aurantiaca]
MEDYKYLIYIALAILYYVIKGIGSKKKPATRQKQTTNTGQPQEQPKTFEDIIRELSGEAPRREEREFEEAEPLSDQVEERVLEQSVGHEEYENADDTLKELYKKGERLKSINELVDFEEVEKEGSRFDAFSIEREENEFAREIRDGLSDPESAKKAIIYAEILNRKY